jgi:hypothetical protein
MAEIIKYFLEIFGIIIPTEPTLVDIKGVIMQVTVALLIFRGAVKILTAVVVEMLRMRRL